MAMTVRTLKLGGRDYVVVPRSDFEMLQERAKGVPRTKSKPRRLSAQDRGDIAEAARRLNDPSDGAAPYAEARKRLRLG